MDILTSDLKKLYFSSTEPHCRLTSFELFHLSSHCKILTLPPLLKAQLPCCFPHNDDNDYQGDNVNYNNLIQHSHHIESS